MILATAVFALALAASRPARSQVESGPSGTVPRTIDTFLNVRGLENGYGSAQRPTVNQAHALVQQHRFDEAEPIVDRVIAYFEGKKTDAEGTYISLANRSELNLYMTENPTRKKVYWFDWAFGNALHEKTFIAVARKQWAQALAHSDRELAYRPYAAEPWTERGFILNALGKRNEALQAYHKAKELSDRFESSAFARPVALRGIGWTLVELRDLQGAREAYEASLKDDPQSRIAREELDFIRRRMGQ